MAVLQFSLFDPKPSTDLVPQIAKILECEDNCLLDAICFAASHSETALAIENLIY